MMDRAAHLLFPIEQSQRASVGRCWSLDSDSAANKEWMIGVVEEPPRASERAYAFPAVQY